MDIYVFLIAQIDFTVVFFFSSALTHKSKNGNVYDSRTSIVNYCPCSATISTFTRNCEHYKLTGVQYADNLQRAVA